MTNCPGPAARHGAARGELRRRARRAAGHRRPVRVGQVDSAAPNGHAGPAQHRHRAGHRPGRGGLSDRELSALRAASIGFVFQQFFLAEHATALDNVADGLLYAGVALAERRYRAAKALGWVGLGHKLTGGPADPAVWR